MYVFLYPSIASVACLGWADLSMPPSTPPPPLLHGELQLRFLVPPKCQSLPFPEKVFSSLFNILSLLFNSLGSGSPPGST